MLILLKKKNQFFNRLIERHCSRVDHGRNSGAAPLPKGSPLHSASSLQLEPEEEIEFGVLRSKPTNIN
jgi:hypothetical protein